MSSLLLLAGVVFVGFVALGLAWYAARRLTRPVRLNAATQTKAAGPASDMSAEGQATKMATAWSPPTKQTEAASLDAVAISIGERQFVVLAESLPQIVWRADARGLINYVNRSWIRAYKPKGPFFIEELQQVNFFEHWPAFLAAWRHSLKSGDDMNVRCRLHTPDDPAGPRWFEFRARAIKAEDGSAVLWVGTIGGIDK